MARPPPFIQLLDPRPLVSGRCSMTTILPGESVGTRHVSTQSSNSAALIGPSNVAAVGRRERRPAIKVTVL